MKAQICLLLICIVSFQSLILEAYCSPHFETDATGIVYDVIDGDTFDVTTLGRIRLADIDAPDIWEPGYDEARNLLTSLVYERRVILDVDDFYRTDIYDRLVCVAYVMHNSTHFANVNKALLESDLVNKSDYPNEFMPDTWTAFVYLPLITLPDIYYELQPNHVRLLLDHEELNTRHHTLEVDYGMLEDKYDILQLNYTSLERNSESLERSYEELDVAHEQLTEQWNTLKANLTKLAAEHEELQVKYQQITDAYETSKMEPLYVIRLLRDFSLALFAVSTWYIRHEEKRARILFDIALATKPIANLVEIAVELRDSVFLNKTFSNTMSSENLSLIQSKLSRLRRIDRLKGFSIWGFALSLLIEVCFAIFRYFYLPL